METLQLVAAICLGVLIGSVATYKFMKNPIGPMERTFMLKSGIPLLVLCLLYLSILEFVPRDLLARWIKWIWAGWIVLIFAIVIPLNRKQASIHREERTAIKKD